MTLKNKPSWLKVKLPTGDNYLRLKSLINKHNIHTICHEARCPNVGECSSKSVATFLLLGNKCTRNCLYCNVEPGKPNNLDMAGAETIVNAVKTLRLKYVVITSVTRDDLNDGGAYAFVNTIELMRNMVPECKTEVLVPDFAGRMESIEAVVKAKPFVFGHNIEVAEPFFNKVRPQGDFKRSLKVLNIVKDFNIKQKTKSGLMIGLGETDDQIIDVMKKLRDCGVDILTIGQYLQPAKNHYPVKKYYEPGEFKMFEDLGMELGFSFVKSGPLVRSSYMAEEAVKY